MDWLSQRKRHEESVYNIYIMSTIRVTDDMKERLRDLKRDDESFTDFSTA